MKGHVELFGERTKAPLHRRARRGLALVPEQRSIFRRITAEANLKLGLGPVDDALGFAPELANRLNVRAGLLSGGEQQILVLARALAAEPACPSCRRTLARTRTGCGQAHDGLT